MRKAGHQCLAGVQRVAKRGRESLPAARKPAAVRLHDTAKHDRAQLPTEMQEGFAHLMHSVVLAFSRIKTEMVMEQERVVAQWADFRGLSAWTDERLELLETRMQRVEGQIQSLAAAAEIDAGQPPTQAIEELKAILTNYEFARGELRRRTPPLCPTTPPDGLDPFCLAEDSGVSVATVNRFRKDPTRVSPGSRKKIEEAVGRAKAKAPKSPETGG